MRPEKTNSNNLTTIPIPQTSGKSAKTVTDPQLLELPAAVSEIRQACTIEEPEAAAGNIAPRFLEPYRSPFFFIVGAGISYPPVPLAMTIIEHCRDVAKRYNRDQPLKGPQMLEEYSYWFSRAYPGARQRQQYLRSLIEKKPISLASLRLAHLLAAQKLTNLVVTTNFDDFIARALRLFGEEPAVCDHPRTVGRIDRERDDIQIVHVHGSYLFYDCANLRGEVTSRARHDAETSLTMVGLLDSLLWNRSPLVIGYSGWDGDVIMSALKRRLRGGNPLAQSVYWFCHGRAERDRLPAWLRESPDLRFVVPPEPLPEPSPAVRIGTETKPEPTLPAFEMFDQLNRAFTVGPPALFENPIKCLAQSLESALPEAESAAGDPYGFRALIERLYRSASDFPKTKAVRGLEADLDHLRALMRESQYPAAVKLLAKIVPARLAKLEPAAHREVIAAAGLAGSALYSELEGGKRFKGLENVLVFDPKLDRMLGQLPAGTTWIVGSRTGQSGSETTIASKPHGAFTWYLCEALHDPASDRDNDGRISLLEATIEAGSRLLRNSNLQTPVVAGESHRIALFSSSPRPVGERPKGTLHAMLVGVGKHRKLGAGAELGGPINDVVQLKNLLERRERRLFQRPAIRQHFDAQATRGRIEGVIDDVVADAKPEDIMLFYFSGHGGRRDATKKPEGGQEIFLVFYDYDGKGAGEMTHSELTAAFAPVKAEQKIVILDF